jgi:glycerophosphoryl diester phosphodiesterase
VTSSRQDGPLAIAHRGGVAEAPENTLAAFRHALSLGIRWFELDVQMSHDGELVVIHDETVDRTTGGSGPVGSMTYGELRRLDAGSWFGPDFKGEVVPNLREVLELCAAHGSGVLVELKSPHLYPGLESKVATLLGELRSQGARNFWCISFDHAAIRRLHELDGELPLGYLYLPWVTNFARPDDTVQAYCPFYLTASSHPEQVARAHELGKWVFVWTVNDEPAMRAAMEIGVDGIISDEPSVLLKVLNR